MKTKNVIYIIMFILLIGFVSADTFDSNVTDVATITDNAGTDVATNGWGMRIIVNTANNLILDKIFFTPLITPIVFEITNSTGYVLYNSTNFTSDTVYFNNAVLFINETYYLLAKLSSDRYWTPAGTVSLPYTDRGIVWDALAGYDTVNHIFQGSGFDRVINLYAFNYTNITCSEDWVLVNQSCNGIISGYFIEYTDNNMCNTTYTLPINNGSLVSCCVEDFVLNPAQCIGNFIFTSFTDANSCGTNFTIPSTNNTLQPCTLPPQNITIVTPEWYIPYIFLFVVLILITVLAITVHPLFFWMGAVIMSTMITLNIYYTLPNLFSYIEFLVILMYIGMGILIKKKD